MDELTPQQHDAVEAFKALRGVEPFGPFVDLLASPELMRRVSALGEYLRYRSALPPRLSEVAILITAAHWQQQLEWAIHAPIALKGGVPQVMIDALWKGERPAELESDTAAVYDVCVAMHKDRLLPPDVRERAEALLGKQAVIDTIAMCGYYALLAMVLNARPK